MLKRQNSKQKKKGFTLIELIIVIAIMAILAAIAIPNFAKIRTDSKVKADTQTLETIKRVVQTKITDDTIAPADKDIKISWDGSGNMVITDGGNNVTSTLKDYFKEVKKPQESGKSSYIITIDANGNITGAVTATS